MTCGPLNPMPEAAAYRRTPETVMRLDRLGSFHRTRLSFMPVLLRRLEQENWRFDRPVWRIGGDGVGCAVYRAQGPERTYSLVAFAHDLPDEMRSDRVIATAWDATFALFDGTPTDDDIARLSENVPKQEAGRISDRELCLSRANRSVRLWNHVVERLSHGEQPDGELVDSVGYLMRTTAVYGSGKFGASDRSAICDRPELRGPFRAEMLSVWLIRAFTVDLVEHLARAQGGDAAAVLEPELRRRIGVGNSTGLGMAPFLVNHPILLNNWIMAREEALARVRALPFADDVARRAFGTALAEALQNAMEWRTQHPVQERKLDALRADLGLIATRFHRFGLAGDHPWDALYRWGEKALTLEGQEQLVALMIEPHGEIVDGLADCMDADEDAGFRIDGTMRVETLRAILREHYDWALADYSPPDRRARFWYVSEEKLEPRLGERHEEPGADLELPLATGRDVAAMADALEGETVAAFLLAHPEFRHAVRRAQIAARYPFSEIRDNLIDAKMLPIDLLRCKLSFFGATKFDPRSDRWVRICMYQGAPFPHEMRPRPILVAETG